MKTQWNYYPMHDIAIRSEDFEDQEWIPSFGDDFITMLVDENLNEEEVATAYNTGDYDQIH